MRASDFNKPNSPYFLSHSIGLAPGSARAALNEGFMDPWAAADGKAWDAWLAAIEDWRASLAPVIGAQGQDICPQTNISGALAKALFSLPRGGEKSPRTRIVMSEDDFPTVGFALGQGKSVGLETVFIKGGPRLADPDAWEEAFSEDVLVLHITHVFSNLGLKAPVREIVARAREKGVVTIVDVGQSAGAALVDVAKWGADFVTGTSVKYLCGGPGAAFLWVNPDSVSKFEPVDVGWFSHARPFEFDIRKFDYAEGALRFWGGTPSVAPFAVARAGAKAIAETGVSSIEARSQALLDRILARLPAEAIASHIVKGERGSAFIVQPAQAAAARAALAEERIFHDERAGGFRFSVHLYTDEEEAGRLTDLLQRFC